MYVPNEMAPGGQLIVSDDVSKARDLMGRNAHGLKHVFDFRGSVLASPLFDQSLYVVLVGFSARCSLPFRMERVSADDS